MPGVSENIISSTDSFVLQLHKQKQKWRENTIVLDTYRMAFEEQLARNRGLIRKIAQLTSNPQSTGRVDKAKAAIKWVIKQLNDG